MGMYGYCNSDKNLLGMGTGVEIQPLEDTTEAERAWAQEHDGQHMYVHMRYDYYFIIWFQIHLYFDKEYEAV